MENKVLATVNKKEITERDVQVFMQSFGQQAAQYNNEQGKEMLLNELINQNLFYFNAIETNLEDSEEYKKMINEAKENVLKQLSINKLLSTIKVTEADAKEFFEKNKAKYVKQESVEASHILVKEEEKINEISEKLEKEEIKFEDAAKEFSNCPSKNNGGSLGSFTRGKMVPEFEKVAFEMEIGEISKPVKTQFGFHIIKVDQKTNKEEMSFEEAKAQVEKTLLMDLQKKAYLDKVNELKEKFTVTRK